MEFSQFLGRFGFVVQDIFRFLPEARIGAREPFDPAGIQQLGIMLDDQSEAPQMKKISLRLFAAGLLTAGPGTMALAAGPTDPQIAHIAYTAGNIDITAGKQALARSHNKAVRAFASEMVRDHSAVNAKALALVKKLHVTPATNPTSKALSGQAAATLHRLSHLQGRSFDRAYVENEVAYHKTVNGALADTLIPSAKNGELKSLLQTGLSLFREHQAHAEHLSAIVK